MRVGATSENKGPKARPNFDHEKPKTDRPRFDKPEFKKYGSDKVDRDKPRVFKRDGDSRGPSDKREPGRPTPDRYAKSFKPREDAPRESRGTGENPERLRFERSDDSRSFKPRENSNPGARRAFGDRTERPRTERSNDSKDFKPREDFKSGERKPFAGDRPERPRFEKGNDSREFKPRPESDRRERPFQRERPERGDFKKKDNANHSGEREVSERTPREENTEAAENNGGADRRVGRFESAPKYNLAGYEKKGAPKKKEESNEIRLNRYIANAGICSRREADDLISSGQISVNGKTITEMGYKVMRTDVVKYGKKALNPEKMVYILINKPKDYITTTDDPEDRKTVLDLIKGACSERVYPVGRLDRNTTGLLLMTNDGELAKKLTHPSGGIKKIYQAELDKPITTEDFELLETGVELEDGFIRPDEVGIVTPDAMVVGLEIHSGRNRIVRRIFEHLGYEVQKLDRTVFAGLDKKDLPRGKWRFLSEKEVVKLKFML